MFKAMFKMFKRQSYQAKDAGLVAYSTELKEQATRRLGQLMEELRQAGLLAKAGRPNKIGVSKTPNKNLLSQGIDTS